ncbi:MAG: transposase, partial [Spirochaetaceae bacterium]|nr:transposase [Spirochaetaceae bacterium]
MRPGRGYGGLKSDELFAKARALKEPGLIRIVQNRMTVGNKGMLDEIRKKRCQGRVAATIPRDSRSGVPEREAVLQVRYASYAVKRPQILNKVKTLPEAIAMHVIYVREEKPVKGKSPIEWFLVTSEPVNSTEEAYEYVGYYMQRWKIERFHYVLKSGCGIEKLQERSMEKT